MIHSVTYSVVSPTTVGKADENANFHCVMPHHRTENSIAIKNTTAIALQQSDIDVQAANSFGRSVHALLP